MNKLLEKRPVTRQTLIETPHLIMREFTLDDIEAVFEFSSDDEVTRYTGDLGVVKTREDARNVIINIWMAEYKKYGYARYALVHKADDRVIGFCGMKFEPEAGAPDIGYRMLKQYWGQGLGFEAANAALEYGKNQLGLDNIFGEAIIENIASNKILERIGLKLDCQFQNGGFILNRYK